MERKISFANLQEVVKSAYELNKSEKGGTIDPRVASEAKAGSFGISVVLTDGRSVDKGDADALFALGKIARIPLAVVLKTQQAAAAKDGQGAHCGCGCDKGGACSCAGHEKKEKLPLGRCGIRAISAIVPQGDPEGKYGVISNMLVALANSEPAFSDKLYKLYQEEVASMDIENAYRTGSASTSTHASCRPNYRPASLPPQVPPSPPTAATHTRANMPSTAPSPPTSWHSWQPGANTSHATGCVKPACQAYTAQPVP